MIWYGGCGSTENIECLIKIFKNFGHIYTKRSKYAVSEAQLAEKDR